MNDNSVIHDLIIVGSGPAGYTAAIYAARAELNPLVFEGSLTSGGALMNTTEVENYPGFENGILGPQLMEQMRTQADRFGAKLITDDVIEVKLAGNIKLVTDSEGNIHCSRMVILATGSEYRKLGIPDEDRLSGRGVSWCATCDGAFFKDRMIAVVGGGDSAIEEASFLSRFGQKVTIIHRREELRASKIMVKRAMENPKIDFAWNSIVSAINGKDKVSSLTLRDVKTNEERDLPADGVFIAIGHDPRSQLFADQVTLNSKGYVEVAHPSTKTNLAGVFACGDLVDFTYQQAITAAASGCRAAIDAEHYLAELND